MNTFSRTTVFSAFAALFAAAALLLPTLAGCQRSLYDPARATRPYPAELHRPQSVDIQLFRDGEYIELVNTTAQSYRDFDLWLNQRYVSHVEALEAGSSIRLSLWDFYDERGEVINPGGLFRTDDPTPIRLAQIQIGEDQPLIGIITIRGKDEIG